MDWWMYLLKINLGLLALGLVYYLFFKKQTDFTWQRWWLIGGSLLMMVIPLLPPLQTVQTPSVQWINLEDIIIQPIEINNSAAQSTKGYSWTSILGIIYFSGVIFFGKRFLVKLFFLLRLINSSRFQKEGKYRINSEAKNLPTFSFFHWIFMGKSADLGDEEKDQILMHEKVHIDKGHSLDLFIMECLAIMNWFNPIVYYLRKQLTLLHEYEADAGVIKKYDRKNYSMLMAAQALNLPGPILSHTFQNSFILKRIAMLKIQRRKITRIQGAFMLLMVGMIGFGLSCESTSGLFSEPEANILTAEGDVDIENEMVYMITDEQATFPGGWEAWYEYLRDSIRYPEEAKKKGIEGRVFIKFIVNEDGRISNIGVQMGIGGGCDEAAVEVLRNAPDFIPSTYNGERVKSWMSLAINFRLSEDEKDNKDGDEEKLNIDSNITTENKDEAIMLGPDEQAMYPGGWEAWYEYLRTNLRYPEEAKNIGIEGRVFLKFVVNEDGGISNVEVQKGIGGGCDEMAIKLVQNAPNFIPATYQGERVKSWMTLAVNFRLN